MPQYEITSQRVAVVGGGGLGIELIGYLRTSQPSLQIGIVDRDSDAIAFSLFPDLVRLGNDAGDVVDRTDWVFLIGIGDVERRATVYHKLLAQNLRIGTFVHPTAYIAPHVQLGQGSLVCPNAMVNAGATVGENVLINVCASVGHGSTVGNHSVLSPFVSLSGDSKVGQSCFLGTRATLFPSVEIGDDCVVDAHSCVRTSAARNKIISTRSKYLVLERRDRS